jgi:hypothetical protein
MLSQSARRKRTHARTRTHARARTHACAHARTHARTRAKNTRTHSRTHAPFLNRNPRVIFAPPLVSSGGGGDGRRGGGGAGGGPPPPTRTDPASRRATAIAPDDAAVGARVSATTMRRPCRLGGPQESESGGAQRVAVRSAVTHRSCGCGTHAHASTMQGSNVV